MSILTCSLIGSNKETWVLNLKGNIFANGSISWNKMSTNYFLQTKRSNQKEKKGNGNYLSPCPIPISQIISRLLSPIFTVPLFIFLIFVLCLHLSRFLAEIWSLNQVVCCTPKHKRCWGRLIFRHVMVLDWEFMRFAYTHLSTGCSGKYCL